MLDSSNFGPNKSLTMNLDKSKRVDYDHLNKLHVRSGYVGSKAVVKYHNHLEISYIMWSRCYELGIHPVKLTKLNHVGKWRLNDYRLLMTIFGGKPRYNIEQIKKVHEWLQTLEKQAGKVLDANTERIVMKAVVDTSSL